MLNMLRDVISSDISPLIKRRFREGDIRHCFADISTAQTDLGYQPTMTLEAGLRDLVPWLQEQTASNNHVIEADAELAAKGLTK